MAITRGGRPTRREHAIEHIAPSTASHSATLPQSTSLGSASNTEARINSSVRGITSGKGIRKIARNANERLRVRFDFRVRKAICENAEAFNNEIGCIVRSNCTLQYKDWREVPDELKMPLHEKLLTLFDIDITDKRVQKLINYQMRQAWKGYKYKLRKQYKRIAGNEDLAKAKSSKPKGVTKEDWEYLCDLWADESYKKLAQKNAEARAQRKWESRNGSRSTARHHLARGIELDAPTGQIETWRIRHWHPENGWSSELQTTYDEMMQLRRDHSPEEMTDKLIMEKVLGRTSNRLSGWGLSPSKSQHTCIEGSSRPTYNQVLCELQDCKASNEELKLKFEKLQQQLIEGNMIPQPSVPHASSDPGASQSHLTAFLSSDRGYFTDFDMD